MCLGEIYNRFFGGFLLLCFLWFSLLFCLFCLAPFLFSAFLRSWFASVCSTFCCSAFLCSSVLFVFCVFLLFCLSPFLLFCFFLLVLLRGDYAFILTGKMHVTSLMGHVRGHVLTQKNMIMIKLPLLWSDTASFSCTFQSKIVLTRGNRFLTRAIILTKKLSRFSQKKSKKRDIREECVGLAF